MNIRDFRKPEYNVDKIFFSRWSPRAMSGEEIDQNILFQLFEAAKWAPSSNNNQPWRFIYARRNTPHWATFFNLLAEGNRVIGLDNFDNFYITLIILFLCNGKVKMNTAVHLPETGQE